MSKNIVILGGGFGGLYTALSLSKMPLIKRGLATITLVEKKSHFLFTPLLYELLTEELQPWQIAPSYQKLLQNTSINFYQDKVTDINLDNREIILENKGILIYDYLVLALGIQNRYADIVGVNNYALNFRNIEDLKLLNQRLNLLENTSKKTIKITIIGGGANGVELACKLADRLGKRGEIHLIQRSSHILHSFPSGLIKKAKKALINRKVLLHCNTDVLEVKQDEIIIKKENEQTKITTDIIIWTAGTQCLEILKSLPSEKNYQGKLITLPTLQLPKYPEVLALGDLACIPQGKKFAPAKAQSAYQQADCAAYNLKALLTNKSLQKFRYVHLGDMMTLGKKSGIVSSFGFNITGYIGDVIRRLVYIQRLPNNRHRLQVFKHWFINSLQKRLFFRKF